MTSTSKLGEPLNAEIELLAVTPEELSSIQAALASDQVYQEQMLEKPISYPFINIAVSNNSKGQPVLKLTSSQPITEAFLDMLIQVDWPTGRLVKEYTLLLDPPGFNSNYVAESTGLPAAAQPEIPAVTAQPQPAPAPPAETEALTNRTVAPPPAARASAAQKATPVEKTPDAGPGETLTTARGDTLYGIARQMKPDNVSMEQMLAALYQSNQDAFDGKNMNRLKVGKIIRIPDPSVLNNVSPQQANSVVAEHTNNWLAYKNALGQAVKSADASDRGGNSQQSAGKIGSAQDKPTSQAATGKDVLKLSAGDESSSSQTDKSIAKNTANAEQEDAIARENAIKEEQSRAAVLEKQVADMKKLMELKNNALSQAEQNAAQANADQPDITPAPEPAEAPAESVLAPSAENADDIAPTQEKAQQPLPAIEPEPEIQQPSFMQVLLQRLKNISPVLPWALIALPILICIWAIIRIRRKKEIETFEDAIVTSPATEMQNTVFGDTQAASGDTSFLTDFSQSGVGGMIDSHDVDPIAEAEVYMAYGRDAQAEEILKDAIQKDPERQELKLKLLEIYQGAANAVAFEALASEMYASVGPTDPAWAKVVAMGQKVDPENPLYQLPASDVSITEPVMADQQGDEEAYHFNFEAPALEFDDADAAVRTVAEGVIVQDTDDSNNENVSDDFVETPVQSEELDPSARLPELPETAFNADAPVVLPEETLENDSGRQEMDLNFEPSLAPAPQDEQTDLNQVENELTPKALDLPSLNFDNDPVIHDEVNSSMLSASNESLASDDAVFETLPELSLELGGPNDPTTENLDEPLEIEEDMMGSANDSLSEEPLEQAEAPATNFPDISLDVTPIAEANAATLDDEPEEVNTKLDLIQAYIDMEDMIGAKELIDEVLSEGGERQRQRATELLSKVA